MNEEKPKFLLKISDYLNILSQGNNHAKQTLEYELRKRLESIGINYARYHRIKFAHSFREGKKELDIKFPEGMILYYFFFEKFRDVIKETSDQSAKNYYRQLMPKTPLEIYSVNKRVSNGLKVG